MKPFGFPKHERLTSKKSIDFIFESGRTVFAYPIKAFYSIEELQPEDIPVQAMFVVPKKKFKRAVDRNAIRRRVRETYRLTKHLLSDWCLQNAKVVRIAFIYIASEQLTYTQIFDATQRIISQLRNQNQQQNQ